MGTVLGNDSHVSPLPRNQSRIPLGDQQEPIEKDEFAKLQSSRGNSDCVHFQGGFPFLHMLQRSKGPEIKGDHLLGSLLKVGQPLFTFCGYGQFDLLKSKDPLPSIRLQIIIPKT